MGMVRTYKRNVYFQFDGPVLDQPERLSYLLVLNKFSVRADNILVLLYSEQSMHGAGTTTITTVDRNRHDVGISASLHRQ